MSNPPLTGGVNLIYLMISDMKIIQNLAIGVLIGLILASLPIQVSMIVIWVLGAIAWVILLLFAVFWLFI